VTGRSIAVIGGGISGLTAAYLLSRTNQVTLYEADGRLGGHADTHLVVSGSGQMQAVDTGFIVYNERTYPLLTTLFAELGVATRESEMSMSVRCTGCGLEYAGKRGLSGIAAGVGRGGRRYLRMLTEIPRFHRAARSLLGDGATGSDEPTFGEFLASGRYSRYFRAHFALPLVAAVWSCPPGTAERYPARYLFAFLANHGMLSVSGSPGWRTVAGGSRSYVNRIAARITSFRLPAPVRAVHRYPDGVEVREASGEARTFDAAVIATHSDQALRMLDRPTPAERAALGAFRYTRNAALLHTDRRMLPARSQVQASWNYQLNGCPRRSAGPPGTPRIHYHMNRLQGLTSADDYIVTLGGGADERLVIDQMDYSHPAYTPESVAAQRRLPSLNTPVTVFAGAYHGWGFHEDGCRSGAEAARALGATW
jgi:predicted NAD/FAD-binding protein